MFLFKCIHLHFRVGNEKSLSLKEKLSVFFINTVSQKNKVLTALVNYIYHVNVIFNDDKIDPPQA